MKSWMRILFSHLWEFSSFFFNAFCYNVLKSDKNEWTVTGWKRHLVLKGRIAARVRCEVAGWLPIGWLSVRSAALRSGGAHALWAHRSVSPATLLWSWVTCRELWLHSALLGLSFKNRFKPVQGMSGKPAFKISTLNVALFALLLQVSVRFKCSRPLWEISDRLVCHHMATSEMAARLSYSLLLE